MTDATGDRALEAAAALAVALVHLVADAQAARAHGQPSSSLVVAVLAARSRTTRSCPRACRRCTSGSSSVDEQLAQASAQSTRTRIARTSGAAQIRAIIDALRAARIRTAVVNDSAPADARRSRAAADAARRAGLLAADRAVDDRRRRVLHVGHRRARRPRLRRAPRAAHAERQAGDRSARRPAGLDSIRYGALYASGGRVLFWTVVPVFDGKRRIGYMAQQRLYRNTPQNERLVRELLGNDVSLYLHNVTDNFWATYIGEPTAALSRHRHGERRFRRHAQGRGQGDRVRPARARHAVGALARGAGERGARRAAAHRAPAAAHQPAHRRRSACWRRGWRAVASRGRSPRWPKARKRSRAAAYDTRIAASPRADARRGRRGSPHSFNRMASEIEASHHELEQQVEEALAVSAELEETNEQLQEAVDGSGGGARRGAGGEPRQERVPRRDEPRAAHAAQRDRRLRGAPAARHLRPGDRAAAGGTRPHRAQPADPARPHQRRAQLRQARRRPGAVPDRRRAAGGRAGARWSRSSRRSSACKHQTYRFSATSSVRRARRPRQAAADPAQPALQRHQVHPGGRRASRVACRDRRRVRRASRCATPASASRPSDSRRCSIRSCRWTARSTGRTRASGSASRSAATSRAGWAARSPSRSTPGEGSVFTLRAAPFARRRVPPEADEG